MTAWEVSSWQYTARIVVPIKRAGQNVQGGTGWVGGWMGEQKGVGGGWGRRRRRGVLLSSDGGKIEQHAGNCGQNRKSRSAAHCSIPCSSQLCFNLFLFSLFLFFFFFYLPPTIACHSHCLYCMLLLFLGSVCVAARNQLLITSLDHASSAAYCSCVLWPGVRMRPHG